ncbi:MAG: type I-E CRISPR-associated protein Cse2/CasB [Solirubrobacterales bacterium]
MKTPAHHPTTAERTFVARLERLVERGDRGTLAALRRGLGDRGGGFETLLALGRLLPEEVSEHDERTFTRLGALFASTTGGHRTRGQPPGDLGASLGRLVAIRSEASVRPRFLALVGTAETDLDPHLRRVVALLDSDGIGIDWAQLLHDLRAWNHPERVVQRRWSRSFARSLVPLSDGDADREPASEGDA